MKNWVLTGLIISSTAGCSLAPTYLNLQPIDHVSHLTAGPPFGRRTEEDTLNQTNLLLGWNSKSGRTYLETGIGYMWKDSGFYGPRFTASLRVGTKICLKQEKCQ